MGGQEGLSREPKVATQVTAQPKVESLKPKVADKNLRSDKKSSFSTVRRDTYDEMVASARRCGQCIRRSQEWPH